MGQSATTTEKPSTSVAKEMEKRRAPTITDIRPPRGWARLHLGDVWEYRELLVFFVWRDIKVRYKQTALGVLWVILQPLVTMVIFSFLFGQLLKVPSGDVPYPIFAYAALLPWNYFSSSLTRASGSIVQSSHLVTKVYFPRLIIPISDVVSTLLDFGVAFLVLVALMLAYGMAPGTRALLLPFFLLLAMITALGFGLWFAALNVRFRDVGYVMPFLIQLWMYVTPVVYGSTLIPDRFQVLLGINPMTAVVEGFRWALLGQKMASVNPPGPLFAVSIAISLLALGSGLIFFRTTERTFADIV